MVSIIIMSIAIYLDTRLPGSVLCSCKKSDAVLSVVSCFQCVPVGISFGNNRI